MKVQRLMTNACSVMPAAGLISLMVFVYGANLWAKSQSLGESYHVSLGWMGSLITAILTSAVLMGVWLNLQGQKERLGLLGRTLRGASLLSLAVVYLGDLCWITLEMQHQGKGGDYFSQILINYAYHSAGIYLVLLSGLAFSYSLVMWRSQALFQPSQAALGMGLVFVVSLSVLPIGAALYLSSGAHMPSPLTPDVKAALNLMAGMAALLAGFHTFYRLKKKQLTAQAFIRGMQILARLFALVLVFQVFSGILPWLWAAGRSFNDKIAAVSCQLVSDRLSLMLLGGYVLTGVFLIRHMKKKAFDDHAPTSGKFGTAAWASPKDYAVDGLYDPKKGVVMGADESGRLLYLPLSNTLIIAPPGGGKSLQLIQTLLTENRPIFALDVKGELAAVTARFRAQTMGRRVVILDCYGVLAAMGAHPDILSYIEKFNPFAYLPEDEQARSRIIDSFAESFILREKESRHQHFEEFAHTLIRGIVDFVMKSVPDKKERRLKSIYDLLNENKAEMKITFASMESSGGYAEEAVNQLSKIGRDEKGSFFSTAYRQVKWLGDPAIAQGLSHNTFDLADFLKGNMDIYFVLPGDKVKSQSRLMRMLLSLLRSLLIRTPPDQLTPRRMLFMFDELAQMDYCQDVEEFIELMRSYRMVVWAVFQSLKQINVYKKPDLFLGMDIKQFFTFDDVETLQWLQSLGGKATVNVKSLSASQSDSHQKLKLTGGNVSTTDGQSVHETGVDLIKLNEIREMPKDRQILVWRQHRLIQCQKTAYYRHPAFKGKFDANPLERYPVD